MTGRLRRFLHLERPRADGGGDADPTGASARMRGVEQPGPAPGEAVAEGHLDRFRPPPERPLELDARSDEAQPFVRCMRCETDHGRGIATCSTCGADLETPEQRAFNERLWAVRQAERRAEAAAAERREAERRARSEEEARERRAMGEALARGVGDLERRRIAVEERAAASGTLLGDGLGASGLGGAPLLVRILRALPDWRWQVGAIVLAVATVAGLFAFGRAGHPVALVVGAVLAVVLLVPPIRARGGFGGP